MRILFASLAFPFPANKGHRVRNSSLLIALEREGHRVTLVTFAAPRDLAHLPEAERHCERVVTVDEPQPNLIASLALRARAALSGTPYGVKRFRSPQMTARLQTELAAQPFDAILCDDIYMVQNLPDVAGQAGLPVLLNKHDLTFEIMERYAAFEPNAVKRAYIRFEAGNVRRWEQRACREASAVLACSERDRQLISTFCPAERIWNVPNAMNVEQLQPASGDDGRTLLYFGAMDWYPNVDAVRFFAGEVLPLLRKLSPGVRLVIAGRSVDPRFQAEMSAADVIFTGEVPDMTAEIVAATLCVVPLRIGSGTRLKIIESSGMEKATVSTSIGAEGLEFVDGSEIAIADTPESFARATAELLASPERRQAMGQAARRRALDCYSIAALQTRVRQALSASIPSAGCQPLTAVASHGAGVGEARP